MKISTNYTRKMIYIFNYIFAIASSLCLLGCIVPTAAERAYQIKQNQLAQDIDVNTVMSQRAMKVYEEPMIVRHEAFRKGQEIISPRVLRAVEPKYPITKLKSRDQNTVWAAILLSATGKVKDVATLGGVSEFGDVTYEVDEVFAEATVNALKNWEFSPQFIDGEATESVLVIAVLFQYR